VNALAALSYADRRALINAVRALPKRPGRLTLWTLYALAIAGFGVVKLLPHTRSATPSGAFTAVIGDLWVCGMAVVFGIALATGSARWLGAFSSRAEALLITRAHAQPLAVAAYLQVRAVGVALARGFARFAYLIVIGIPSASSPGALFAQLFFFAAAGAAIASVTLPRALARGVARPVLVVAGGAIALAAAVPLILDLLRALQLPQTATLLARAPVAHPGGVLDSLSAGDLRPVAIPLALAACATAAFVIAARDAYPELFEISVANLEFRTARTRQTAAPDEKPAARRRFGRLRSRAVRSTAGTRLRGAAAFVWIDSLMFSRRISPLISGIVAALALAAGAAFALFANQNPELAFGIVIGALPGLTIAVASTTGVRLAPALRMPLFWLGSVPLAARLGAWTLGAFWRDAVFVALVVAGYVTVSGDVYGATVLFIGVIGLLGLTRAVGLAVFALLPNQLDQRGPAVMLRTFVSFALIAPAGIFGTLAALLLKLPFTAAVVAGAAFALVEGTLLIAFAASRLAGRVDRLSTI
jgi:hypothetical protein